MGRNSLQTIANTANTLVAQGNASKDLVGLFTSFTANDPQYLVHIDREKAKSLQVPLNQMTDALQVYMGSVYVNDFDFNNRSYRVYVQADSKYRSQPKDIRQYYLRSDTGKMIPLDNLVTRRADAKRAGDQPLQLVPVGGNRRIGGAGAQLGRRHRGDGSAVEESAAARE